MILAPRPLELMMVLPPRLILTVARMTLRGLVPVRPTMMRFLRARGAYEREGLPYGLKLI